MKQIVQKTRRDQSREGGTGRLCGLLEPWKQGDEGEQQLRREMVNFDSHSTLSLSVEKSKYPWTGWTFVEVTIGQDPGHMASLRGKPTCA